jgi:hypothetical protein
MAINAPNAATECLYSTFRNIGPSEKFFGFLPPHGKRLACGEEISIWGDPQHWLTRFTPNERARRSLEEALAGANPVLVLVKTPAVHLFDATADETKILTLNGGSFVAADPCWGAYSSSSAIACD